MGFMGGILIVDDSPLMLRLFKDTLTKSGYTKVYTAGSAPEAFQILGISEDGKPGKARAQIDLILLDIVMPVMDGVEACRIIKRQESYKDLPVIFVTASKNQLQCAFNAGGMDFIQKDFEQYELLARVKSALKLKKEMDSGRAKDKKMERELQLAKLVQNSVLSPPIINDEIEIHGKYIESDQVSGDMYYWTKVAPHKYAVLILDVSGHGLSSALITMSVRSMLEGMIKKEQDPLSIFQELNQQMLMLFGGTKKLIYFTAIYLLIDTEKKTIEYFNAGHPPGMLMDGSPNPIIRLESTTVPIGIKKNPAYSKGELTYQSGARILLYTDGLVEKPGVSLAKSIMRLEYFVSQMKIKSNEDFIERIAVIKDRKSDDICIISIHLLS
ncbi:sigma-B regulation protein RsbU (phosphoserine phosphatase) [Paenibacillus mucilaginosus]